MDSRSAERPNQKRRTRKDLLRAANRLLREGRNPSLEEIAEEAMVSRATAYRYFPGVDALLLEAALDLSVPEPAEIFAAAPADDAQARVQCLARSFDELLSHNEASMRAMLANSLRMTPGGEEEGAPIRQNRRTPLIDAALAPVREQFDPQAVERLGKVLALFFGIEARVVFKDVLQLDDADARDAMQWALAALVDAARKR